MQLVSSIFVSVFVLIVSSSSYAACNFSYKGVLGKGSSMLGIFTDDSGSANIVKVGATIKSCNVVVAKIQRNFIQLKQGNQLINLRPQGDETVSSQPSRHEDNLTSAEALEALDETYFEELTKKGEELIADGSMSVEEVNNTIAETAQAIEQLRQINKTIEARGIKE